MNFNQALIPGLLGILVCQFLGETIRVLTQLPIPGPVLGLLLFFAYLQLRRPGANAAVVRTADGLLQHMQLFFVPPGVGVVAYLTTLTRQWPAALGGFLASWVAALVVTAVTAAALLGWQQRRQRRAAV